MATGIARFNKRDTYIGPSISTLIDISTSGIRYYDWEAISSDNVPIVDGYTFRYWQLTSGTYRWCPLGYGGSRVYYYVGTTSSSSMAINAYPVYSKSI